MVCLALVLEGLVLAALVLEVVLVGSEWVLVLAAVGLEHPMANRICDCSTSFLCHSLSQCQQHT